MDQAQNTPKTENGWLAPLAVLAAMLLGGGGSPAPAAELALQLTLALLFGAWLWLRAGDRLAQSIPSRAWLFAAVLLAPPLLQLIPMPPSLWQALPGRGTEQDALALVGAQDTWRPISVNPARTLSSLLAIIAAVAVLFMTATAPRAARNRIPAAITLAVILTMLLGAVQLAGGVGGPLRFYVPISTYLDGFQANHNSTADVILIGMIASALALRQWIEQRRLPDERVLILGLAAGMTALFLLGLVLTASRTGILLAPIALSAQATILWPWLRGNRRAIGKTLAGGGLTVAVLAILLQGNAVLQHVMARFDFASESRPEIWRDSYYAGMQFFPFGTGMGTFAPTFATFERIELVAATVSKRAHNEILELLVEGGAFALFLLVSGLILLALTHLRAMRQSDGLDRTRAQFATSSIMILLAHSQVDYPFRSMSLACVAAACVGLLVSISAKNGPFANQAALKEEA